MSIFKVGDTVEFVEKYHGDGQVVVTKTKEEYNGNIQFVYFIDPTTGKEDLFISKRFRLVTLLERELSDV